MVFYGNPGTAKTTVARLYAQILKDNACLAHGDLVECGRADLVGKYVGWTAPMVRAKFKAARGSVLFIDEAYSLLDDKDGGFGREAIDTIIQEMENWRDEVVVIFAGYPDLMEEFVNSNPGLRSRISQHVHFKDYDPQELWQITESMADKYGRRLAEGCQQKLMDIYDQVVLTKDFGNGRLVRTMLEQACVNAVARIVLDGQAEPDPEVLTMLYPEDFEQPRQLGGTVKRIGF
jgi:SpoVK/Ycf46/Vps4 family AAA+-type ATPase